MSDKIDQVFDLLEKVYTELQDTKTELKQDIRKIEMVLENEIKPNIKTLFEAQVQTNEHLVSIDKKLEEHDRRFDILETKVDALSAKTLRQSYEIGAIKRKEARGI